MAYERPAVPAPNAHYPGQRHEDMKKLVDENYHPNAADEVIDAWRNIGKQFTELAVDFNILVNGSQDGWRGKAAEGARAALGKVGAFADATGTAFSKTAQGVEQQRDAAVQANTAMPQPVEYNPAKMMRDSVFNFNPIDNFTLPFDIMNKREEQEQAKEEAVRVMTTRDTTMMSAATSMPSFQDTPVVTQDQGTTQTSSTTFGKTTNSVNPNTQFGQPSMPPGTSGNNNTTNPSWVAPPTNKPLTPPVNPPLPKTPDDRNPRIPGPGPFPPGQRPGPNQGGRGPGGPGGRGIPGGGGPGGRGAGGFGPAGPGGRGGSFGPASPGGGAGVMNYHGPEGARGGAAGAGRGGAPGAAGMGAGAGAGAGQGQEDKEHKSTYLVPTDEYFEDDRMVAPPVIGG